MSTNPYYWFHKAAHDPNYEGPLWGALVFEDGSTLRLDFTVKADQAKVAAVGPENPPVGLALLNRTDNEWTVEVKPKTVWLVGTVFRASCLDLDVAVYAALKARREAREAEEFIQANLEIHLERELACHHWYYYNSSDHHEFAQGEERLRLMRRLAAQVDPETARFLWFKYAPKGFNCPV
jgi:hypothetical protein